MATKNVAEKFEIREIHRSLIKNAPYNPRKINEKQRHGLKQNLKKMGLMYPLVWNEATGNLVSGHQRLSIIDELNKTDDYILVMSVVNLSLKDEMQQNLFLNSTTYQGEFDLIKLNSLIKTEELDFKLCGFDEYDMSMINIDKDVFKSFQPKLQDEEQDDQDEYDLSQEDKKESIKQLKNDIQKQFEDKKEAKNVDSYIILSFSDIKNKQAFCNRFDIPINETIYKGEIFSNMIERIE